MKKFKRIVASVVCMLLALFLFAGCGSKVDLTGKTVVTLWAWGDEAETNAFTQLFNDYNAENEDNIFVNFVKKPSSNYYTMLETALGGREPPDLFYVGDSYVKRYADKYLEDLTPYVEKSSVIDLDDIWGTLMERYIFDTETYRYSEDAPSWGLPKDIGPTVIYYNEDVFKAAGITVISADDEDGDGQVSYNGQTYEARGYDPEAKVFNNRIPVEWDLSGNSDFDQLNDLLASGTTDTSKHTSEWSFYSSWWFCFGWSVGGDCVQFVETDDPAYNGGYYEFTLDNDYPNYMVLEDNVMIDGETYTAGAFVDYYSLDYMAEHTDETANLVSQGKVKELPSILDAVEYWIDLFYNDVSPSPRDISNEASLFINQQVAMFVQGRYNVVDFRSNCNFAWDVAPLPKHADGVEAGHSGSMCVAMSKNSQQKEAAFKVLEYISGPEGQNALAETGFNVPNQISVATDPNGAFLSSDQRPYNNEVFLRAAEYERGGDWTYVTDDAWIEIWSPTFNGAVLNGEMTVEQMFATYKTRVNDQLKTYTSIR